MQAEDLLDDILSFEAGSLGDGLKDGQAGSLTNIPELQIKPEPLLLTEAEIHALAKDRQKKDNHNMSKSIVTFLNQIAKNSSVAFFKYFKIIIKLANKENDDLAYCLSSSCTKLHPRSLLCTLGTWLP